MVNMSLIVLCISALLLISIFVKEKRNTFMLHIVLLLFCFRI
uniref:Uncharacterized protein n=1 Tax=Rhizophora mucronata TaxID=61149 RepID=A0A2P2N1A8_RHIMU